MKWGILATGTIAKKFASTVDKLIFHKWEYLVCCSYLSIWQ